MTASEWAPVDSNPDTGVTAPDLFGGELFGDELMDMYNSAAVVGHEMIETEIPALLGGTAEPAATKTNLEPQETANHPGAYVVIQPAADDGLGAFRPSTSFNDLTSLIPQEVSSGANASGTVIPLVTTSAVPVAKEAPKKGPGRKRAAASATEGPATKKRGGGQRGRPSASGAGRRAYTKAAKGAAARTATAKAVAAQSAGQAALKLRKEQRALLSSRVVPKVSNGTPNPLSVSGGSTRAVPPPPKAAVKIKPGPVTSSITLPPVVSGKPTGSGKGDSITSEAAAATAAAAAVAAAAAAAATAPTPAKAPTPGVPTEADFKSVAQAAVTNLILNAGSHKPDGKGRTNGDVFTGKVNTSTEHIKALTSSNWVNACGGGVDGDSHANGPSAAEAKANNRARRQNLTPEERARQNRDRNREHARNTRLRKKAYVEELKRTLTELVSQRDAAELDKRHAAQREVEQREVRFRVMEEFLKLRGRNESNVSRWVAILEDNFTLTLPRTDYRKAVKSGSSKNGIQATEQVLSGATEVMTDASYVASFLGTLAKGSNQKPAPSLVHHCERKNFFMDGSSAVLDWTATVVGAGTQELKLSFNGVIRAKFSPASNKLISAELIFDSGSVALQLAALKSQKAVGTDKCDEVAAAAAAAQAAANEADALLDSLQMPQLDAVPAAITVMPVKETHSVTCSEKEDVSSDESTEELAMDVSHPVSSRRSARLNG